MPFLLILGFVFCILLCFFSGTMSSLLSLCFISVVNKEIMAMCPKDVVNIPVPRRDDGNSLMRLPIIKLEFEKDFLDSHIIIREKSIQVRTKREKLILCERCIQYGHPKKFCRNSWELNKDCNLYRMVESTIMGENFASTPWLPTR